MNLLSLHAVHDGIQEWRDRSVDVGHQPVDQGGEVLPILMEQTDANHGDVKNEDGTNVGDTSVESLETSLAGCNGENRLQNHNVGGKDDGHIKPQRQNQKNQTIQDIDLNVCTGQLHCVRMETVGVRKSPGSAEG